MSRRTPWCAMAAIIWRLPIVKIGLAEPNLGLSLDEFVALAIEGLQEVAPEIGL